jgi:hypothetical protein
MGDQEAGALGDESFQSRKSGVHVVGGIESLAHVVKQRRQQELLVVRPRGALVVAHGVMGAQVHDARLVAFMLAHGLTHVLTLNAADFARYPGIIPVAPGEILAAPP